MKYGTIANDLKYICFGIPEEEEERTKQKNYLKK